MPKKTEPDQPQPDQDPDWIDALYAEGADEQPPAELDARIQAAARAPRRHWYRNPRRLTTLATAASLVLAATVVLYAPDQQQIELEIPALEDTEEKQAAGERRNQPVIRTANRFRAEAPEPVAVEEVGVRADQARPAAPAALAPDDPAGAAIPPARPVARPAAESAGKSASADAVQDSSTDRVTGRTGEQDLREVRAPLKQDAPTETTALASASAPARRLQEDALAADADLDALLPDTCGPAPGAADQRRIDEDVDGWYLTVTTDERTSFWRCSDGGWREIEPIGARQLESDQQQPDPDHDQ